MSVISAGNIPILLSVNFNGHVSTLSLNSNCRACRILGNVTGIKGLKIEPEDLDSSFYSVNNQQAVI